MNREGGCKEEASLYTAHFTHTHTSLHSCSMSGGGGGGETIQRMWNFAVNFRVGGAGGVRVGQSAGGRSAQGVGVHRG